MTERKWKDIPAVKTVWPAGVGADELPESAQKWVEEHANDPAQPERYVSESFLGRAQRRAARWIVLWFMHGRS